MIDKISEKYYFNFLRLYMIKNKVNITFNDLFSYKLYRHIT